MLRKVLAKKAKSKNGIDYLKVFIADPEKYAVTLNDGKKILILYIFNEILDPSEIKIVAPDNNTNDKENTKQQKQEQPDDFDFDSF